MSKRRYADADTLRQAIAYDPETGIFTRLIAGGGLKAGDRIGTTQSRGYRTFVLGGVVYLAHHVAWILVTGKQAPEEIDHINGNRSDNRFSNLRLATSIQNAQNRKMRADSRQCLKGICKVRNGWKANINVNGKRIYIGYFKTPEAAHEAYLKKARENFGDFARAL